MGRSWRHGRSAVLVVVFVIVGVFVGSDPNEPMGFPVIRVARTFEELSILQSWSSGSPFSWHCIVRCDRNVPRLRCSEAFWGSSDSSSSRRERSRTSLHWRSPISRMLRGANGRPGCAGTVEATYRGVRRFVDRGTHLATIGVICLGVAMIKDPKFGQGYRLDKRDTWCGCGGGVIGFAVEP